MTEHVLEINGLKTSFTMPSGKIYAADDVTLALPRGKITALVGESGSGKSVTAMSILRLIQSPGQIESGEILLYSGTGKTISIMQLSDEGIRQVRGNKVAMIFQEPMTSLNPVYTVGDQIMEAIVLHQKVGSAEARTIAIEMLGKVGISNPELRVDNYPHEMSGGMRQRVMIAMGLSCHPEVLIADEPTTALDVTIQAQILELIGKLVRETGMSVLLITHDLGIVAEYAEKVAVMYAGEIVEVADTIELFRHPRHPYTRGLLDSIPALKHAKEKRLRSIPGTVPNLAHLPHGCRFQERCERATADCKMARIKLEGEAKHLYRCVHPY